MDVATIAAASTTVNVNRDEKKQPKPFEFAWPWPDLDQQAEKVTDEERTALKATLKRYSAFHD